MQFFLSAHTAVGIHTLLIRSNQTSMLQGTRLGQGAIPFSFAHADPHPLYPRHPSLLRTSYIIIVDFSKGTDSYEKASTGTDGV